MPGVLNYMCGMINKGLADLAQAISIDANCPEAYLNCSMIQIESGMFVFQETLSIAKRYFDQYLFTSAVSLSISRMHARY